MLKNHIEALIFCSPHPVKIDEIKSSLTEVVDVEITEKSIAEAIHFLDEKYQDDDFAFQLYHVGGGYQFLTKPAYQASIKILLKQLSTKRLSTSSLETLSIIAYKEPVSKSDMETIRGVNCDYAVQKLLEKGLIEILGKDSDRIGRPLLYGVSPRFLEYFGINSLSELPTLENVVQEETGNVISTLEGKIR